jgi:hypothetical protein
VILANDKNGNETELKDFVDGIPKIELASFLNNVIIILFVLIILLK